MFQFPFSSPTLLQVTPQQQQEIFEPAPSGVRKIVLTTNIAEVLRATRRNVCSGGGYTLYPGDRCDFLAGEIKKKMNDHTICEGSWYSMSSGCP